MVATTRNREVTAIRTTTSTTVDLAMPAPFPHSDTHFNMIRQLQQFVISHTACGLIMVLLASGCSGEKKPDATPEAGPKAAATAKSQQLSQSEDLLNSILSMVKLKSLGFTAQEDDVIGLLNQWQRFSQGNQVLEEEVALDEATLEALRARLTERQLKQVRRSAFQKPDIDRLRNDLLMNAIVKHAVGKGQTDLERATNIFKYLMRNTELITSHPDEIPLSPYQIYLLGKGTAADRAWLFAELLRQLRINSVILSAPLPKNQENDGEDWDVNQPFLVGVLLNQQVYLYDPRLGLPLTVPGMPGAKPDIATLEQARSNPDVLKQYTVADDKPYAVTPELLKSPAVLLVGDTTLWSYRFSRLQKAFTGARAMVISEPLVDHAGQAGLATRVAKWPGNPWSTEQIALWSYPESQLSGLESLSAQHQQTLTRITDGWKMPIVGVRSKSGDKTVEVRRPTNLLLFARLDHAEGNLEDAVKGYTHARVELMKRPDVEQITERVVYAYLMAAEDSLFWTAVCKTDQGSNTDRRIATDKLRQYQQVYAKGRWVDAGHILQAQIYADAGNFAGAIAELDLVTPDHPQSQGLAFLKKTWSAMPAASTPTPPAQK